jgi:hypothetical protein
MSGVPLRQFGAEDGRAVCEIGLRGPRFVAGAKAANGQARANWRRRAAAAWQARVDRRRAAVCAGLGSHWAAAPQLVGDTSEEERLLKIALLEPPNDPYLAVL